MWFCVLVWPGLRSPVGSLWSCSGALGAGPAAGGLCGFTSGGTVFGVLVLGSSELGVSFVLCFIFRAVGFRVLCWVLGSS